MAESERESRTSRSTVINKAKLMHCQRQSGVATGDRDRRPVPAGFWSESDFRRAVVA